MTDFYLWATSRCAVKEYCCQEIATKLRQKGATPDETDELLERLIREKYIDESRYAEAFVSDKFRFDHWGRIKISHSLRQKGIADSLIQEALDRIDDEEYDNMLNDFIQSKRRTTKGDTPYAINQKIARAAISRGFEPHLVFDHLELEE